MLGVTGHVHKHWGSDYTKTAIAARVVALMMMITAIFMAAYSAFLFSSRSSLLKCAQLLLRTVHLCPGFLWSLLFFPQRDKVLVGTLLFPATKISQGVTTKWFDNSCSSPSRAWHAHQSSIILI
jgi:hypothetical protein